MILVPIFIGGGLWVETSRDMARGGTGRRVGSKGKVPGKGLAEPADRDGGQHEAASIPGELRTPQGATKGANGSNVGTDESEKHGNGIGELVAPNPCRSYRPESAGRIMEMHHDWE